MKTFKTKQFVMAGIACMLLLPTLTSCDKIKDAPEPTQEQEPITSTDVEIKSVDLGTGELQQIRETLKDVDPSLYQLQIHKGGKVTERLGSAAISDLHKVGAYYSQNFGSAKASNEIVTTVSDIVKTVWTAKMLRDLQYREQIARVEGILDQSTVYDVALKPVQLGAQELRQIEETLKGIDPSLYQIQFQSDGKVTGRMGSAAITDLQKVGAYYAKDFGGATAANEIVTTVGDYIKTVWTSKLLRDLQYREQIAKVESILNQATVR